MLDKKGNCYGAIESIRDITNWEKTENALYESNKVIKTVSSCNEAIIHASSEFDLLNDIYRIISDFGGYPLTWSWVCES